MTGKNFKRIGDWPDELHGQLAAFLDHMEDRRTDTGIVLKKDIDPLDLISFLPGMMMIDRVTDIPDRDRPRYRYRLLGTEHRARNGAELTGRWFDEVQPAQMVDELEAVFEEILKENSVHYKLAYNTTSDNSYQLFERILCPISRDGTANDILIGYFIWR